MQKKQLGIYIHIPFCKQKCYYCDFISFKNQEQYAEEYVNCIIKEIENQNWNKINKNYKVTTIYIGGGTPSYIDFHLVEKIIQKLKGKIIVQNENQYLNDMEVTIEVNPGTVTYEKLIAYRNAGINRLSIGLQTTNDELLRQIGRIHNFEQFRKTYKSAKEAGFENINIDLMLGLPNQTIEDLKQSIEEVVRLNPSHVSVYSLILEEGTKIFEMVESKKVELPEEELERNMYWYAKNKLELNGYNQYEISNFAKKGKESKHNLNCWSQEEYIGFGLAAHSYFTGKRYSNIDNLKKYIENINNNQIEKNIEVHEVQTLEEQKKEYMLLGLRKIEGVSISKFKEKFIDNPIFLYRKELQELCKEDLIRNRWRLD